MPRYLAALSLLLLTTTLPCLSQQPTSAEAPLTAQAIMARVAANQDRAETERTRYIYVQHARVLSRKGKTVMCEEITDSRIVPSSSGSHAELLSISGRQWKKNHYIAYDTLPKKSESASSKTDDKDELWNDDMDRDLVESMRSNLTNDKSKDGLAARLFPLTSKNQAEYRYQLIGREQKNGRDVFHIRFAPKDKNQYTWKGDAWIDSTKFQPVVISTAMARKVPFVARTLLGTNLPGLGFTVVYAPQSDGVWFPVSFGTEFKLHVLFIIHRQIVIDAQNRSFEKTHVSSHIIEDEAVAPQ
ncbi:MAG: hypothetical protein JSS95_10385 [Acidobacteria bacterium]|nr:hypothetical protein [Acidobacteriota bacterium]